MKVTLSIDKRLWARAQTRARAMGKSINELIRDYLHQLATNDDALASIEEFNRLSGKGHSLGWKFNRDEIYER